MAARGKSEKVRGVSWSDGEMKVGVCFAESLDDDNIGVGMRGAGILIEGAVGWIEGFRASCGSVRLADRKCGGIAVHVEQICCKC